MSTRFSMATRSRSSGNMAARATAAVKSPGLSVGPHQTSDSDRAWLVSVTNGICSCLPLPKMAPLVTGRFTTAWSPANPYFFSPERTTH